LEKSVVGKRPIREFPDEAFRQQPNVPTGIRSEVRSEFRRNPFADNRFLIDKREKLG